MRIFFLGDVAVHQRYDIPAPSFPEFRQADLVIANLEGPLITEQNRRRIARSPKTLALYNSAEVQDVLEAFNIKAVCLANNHMYDAELPAAATQQLLSSWGIASFGAGDGIAQANAPLAVSHGDTAIKVFAYGWPVIGCQAATPSSEGVNPFSPQHTLNTIRALRKNDVKSFVIFIMHWNYELWPYPQPAHRQLAHDLLQEGVDAIIGLHPHVAQGAEWLNRKLAVYSLGNWFMPVRQIQHFTLTYPKISNRQLALELDIIGREIRSARFHWYQFDPRTSQIAAEKVEERQGEILASLTPYAGLTRQEYSTWFRSHCPRGRFLPTYDDYTQYRLNHIKDRVVRLRQWVNDTMVRLRLKRGRRVE